ncbi:protein kinase domain with FHA domain [Frankia sp. QA3]|nr:protein kinase domain with FHA domain [Frankia sp. QA3]
MEREYAYAERTTCILGRAPDCSPVLPDDADHRTVSRHHCLVDINPPDIRIRDFGSLNGTYVNGVKIGQRQAGQTPEEAAATPFSEHDLTHGDKIKLGNTVFAVAIRLRCDDCGRSMLVEASANGYKAGGKDQCRACRAVPSGAGPEQPSVGPTPEDGSRCAGCGRELHGDQRGGGLCESCHSTDLVEFARFLLRKVSEGDRAPTATYTLVRELGRGGMGAVFLARNDVTGKSVALKMMLPRVASRPDARARFMREIDLSRALRHRNIASLYDAGSVRGAFYFTVEYCPGGSVDKLVARRGGKLAVDEAVSLALQALDGLDHAHGLKVVHRDLSPQNILLTGERSPVAKICDFGLAKAFDEAGLSGLTRTGAAAGKPWFMPRQQVLNFKHAKPDVDVWALAASLYWMLTGALPRDFPVRRDPWHVVLQTEAVPIRQRNPAIPTALADVIDHALRDQPAIGFQSAVELRQALEQALPPG